MKYRSHVLNNKCRPRDSLLLPNRIGKKIKKIRKKSIKKNQNQNQNLSPNIAKKILKQSIIIVRHSTQAYSCLGQVHQKFNQIIKKEKKSDPGSITIY